MGKSITFKLIKTDTNVSSNTPYYGEYYCKEKRKVVNSLYRNKNHVKFEKTNYYYLRLKTRDAVIID